MADDWYVVKDGKPTGPYALEELSQLNIRPGTFLKTAGMDDYKEAHEIAELRQLLGFKHRVTLPQYFATLDLRLLAVAIDYFMVTGAVSIVVFLVVLLIQVRIVVIVVALSSIVIIPLVKCVYASIMECGPRQGTFGKTWLGIRVCDEQGLPISGGRSTLRNLAKFVSLLTLGLGFLSGFFNKKQQCLHDIIAQTLVVRERLV